MKRMIGFLSLLLCMALFFCACSPIASNPVPNLLNSVEKNIPSVPPAPTPAPSPSPTPTAAPSTAPAPPPLEQELDFRNARWGMSVDEVIRSEGSDPNSRTGEGLYYENKSVGGFPATVIYKFENNRLIEGYYSLRLYHMESNVFIDDYGALKSAYTDKYGSPYTDSAEWSNDQYKNDASKFGYAIAIGHLKYTAGWQTETSDIKIMLRGSNGEIVIGILYTSLEKLKSDTAGQIKLERDFRNATWGMSMDEVILSEGAEPSSQEGQMLIYNDRQINGFPANAAYAFGDNRLLHAAYLTTMEHSNKNVYIADYNELKKAYTAKHGKPFADKTDWKNRKYKKDKSKYGEAVQAGHLVYSSTWITDNGAVILTLEGADNEIGLGMSYLSDEYIKQSGQNAGPGKIKSAGYKPIKKCTVNELVALINDTPYTEFEKIGKLESEDYSENITRHYYIFASGFAIEMAEMKDTKKVGLVVLTIKDLGSQSYETGQAFGHCLSRLLTVSTLGNTADVNDIMAELKLDDKSSFTSGYNKDYKKNNILYKVMNIDSWTRIAVQPE